MAKLKTLKPLVSTLRPKLGYAPADERGRSQYRDETQPWRRWYKTSRWQKLRWSVLVRDGFQCQKCQRIDGDTSRLVCDHVEPHRGDETLFWSGPFQTLCKGCHDSVKQSEERRAVKDGRY